MNTAHRARRFEGIILWLGALPFIAAFLIHYPPMWTYMDENIYIGLAHTLRGGTIFPDQAQIHIPFLVWNGTHWISQYPLGMPALIALFSFIGWKAIFVSNLFALLIGFFFFARWLRLEGLHPVFSWPYLYYPAIVFYSRTVMSEIPCLALVTAASFYFSAQRLSLAGFLVGIALQFRNTAIFILGGMLLSVFWVNPSRQRVSSVFRLLLGVAPGIAFAILYNTLITGHPFVSPYALTKGQPLSLSFVPKNLLLFAQSTLLMYPFMGLVLFRRCKRTLLFALFASWLFLLFHLTIPTEWITGNQWESFAQKILLQHRYLLPIIPFLLLLYSHALAEKAARIRTSVMRAPLVLLPFLILAAGFINFHHQQYLRALAEFQMVVYDSIPDRACVAANYDALRLLNDIERKRFAFSSTEPSLQPSRLPSTPFYYVRLTNPRTRRPPRPDPFTDFKKLKVIRRLERDGMILEIYSVESRI